MNIYFSVENDVDDYFLISKISLKPFENCYVEELYDNDIFSVEEMYFDELTPYEGEFEADTSLFSKDGKHFIEEEDIPDEDWDDYYEYYKIGVYKDGKLIETKYEKC